ncbi:MAG: 23S rRNA (uracil(1939)-C(5))-methyltransferase RlmD, partial [Clostridia bacterium]|nr:23S rRNA (uracil(1939)-C(5))-methyltransferase RlmD [Clostridia bacterium]
MNLKKNDIVRLNIVDLTSEGMGVGRLEDGFVVFVSYTAPGDVIDAHILKVEKSYAYAKIEKIISPSSMRCESNCDVFEKCGGCLFRHINYNNELMIKKNWVIENFKRIGKIDIGDIDILSANTEHYRNKAQYPAGYDKDGNLRFGFFATHSHRVIPSSNCQLEPEFFSDILKLTENFCNKHQLVPYDDETGVGLIRHLYIRHGKSSGEILVALIINGGELPHEKEYVDTILSSKLNIVSIVLIQNKKRGNTILGDKSKTIYGKDYLTDVLCGLSFNISPYSFYQVNHDGAELLYAKAKEYAELSSTDVLMDLYCGTGTIGLSMAKNVSKLYGVEIIPQAIENAKNNATCNGISNAEFFCGDAGKAAMELASKRISPDVVIVDPPRKGCSAEVFKAIQQMSPNRVVMISCNSATAARDAELFQNIGYSIKKTIAVDMFPRTGHVETVVLLSDKKVDGHIDIDLDVEKLEGKSGTAT